MNTLNKNKENKIFNNPNKIIAKLPISIQFTEQNKACNGVIGNQVKLKLIEPVYFNCPLTEKAFTLHT